MCEVESKQSIRDRVHNREIQRGWGLDPRKNDCSSKLPLPIVPFQQKSEHESDVNLDSSSGPGRQSDSRAPETSGGDKETGVGTRSSLISLLASDPEEQPPTDVVR